MILEERLWKQFDWGLFFFFLAVALFGLINLFSSSGGGVLEASPLFLKQLVFFVSGLLFMLLLASVDYRVLLRWNYPLYVIAFLLLCITLLVGKTIGGGQRWIDLGFFRLQPSEPAKLILIISLASYFSRREVKTEKMGLKDLFSPMLLTACFFVLVLIQPDLGTAMILAILFVSLLAFVRLRFTTLLVLVSVALMLVAVGWLFLLKPYQKQRIATYLDPAADTAGSGYHITQAKIAVGSGGLLGKGYMEGTQSHLNFLPERHTDFAFAVWAEEWGFIGCLLLLSCYLIFLLLAIRAAATARDRFGALLAVGVTALIFWQAAINVFMVLGLVPVVGIPLPLFSYGGSSLLSIQAGTAILLNVRLRRFTASR